ARAGRGPRPGASRCRPRFHRGARPAPRRPQTGARPELARARPAARLPRRAARHAGALCHRRVRRRPRRAGHGGRPPAPAVAVARVGLEGNTHRPTDRLVGSMKTRPEGFWWFRSGEYDDEKLRSDLQENLPKLYGDRGFVDFQVLGDTLLVDDSTGKATLVV